MKNGKQVDVNIEPPRILNPAGQDDDVQHDVRLRPQSLDEYIGQKVIVDNLKVMIASAQMRKSAMDHTLLSGPPGLGKTTLAMIIARTLGHELFVVSGPAVEKKGDLAAILTNLNQGDILFIDEIHRMHIAVEEILYSAMEDYRLDIVLGQGPSARTMQIDLAPFTLIAATTRTGLLSNPLRDRFMAQFHFDFYSPEELAIIVKNNAQKLKIHLDATALDLIARCARGTPRIANRILRRVRDYALVEKKATVAPEEVLKALHMLEIDKLGLDRMDRKILSVIADFYHGGPVGIEALCATLAEDRGTIEDVYEPYLMKTGLLQRTPRGRTISEAAQKHLQSWQEF
jgi:Holliday junction DNA helicase RuvB